MPVMSEAQQEFAPRTEILIGADRRKHRRLPVSLAGRFMRPDRTEFPCRARDISVGGASVTSNTQVTLGERIIAYFEDLGGLEGTVTRASDEGFAFQFKVSDHKREKLASQLMWLANREAFPEEFNRAHERIGTAGRKTTLKMDGGIVVDVDLLDLSVSGASIGTSARPVIGMEISVGRVLSIVRRHHEKGIGVQFLTIMSEDALRANFP